MLQIASASGQKQTWAILRNLHSKRLQNMSLVLYGHPFSSYTQKVLIALDENGINYEFRSIASDTPQHVAEWLRRWPLRKFPLLVDGERDVAETSIIIEYLQLVRPGPVRLLPADAMAALEVRFLDRFFDLHVMNAAEYAVDGALTGDLVKRREGLAMAVEKLERAYAWLEGKLAGRRWATGSDSRWPIAPPRHRCSTPTGHMRSPTLIPCCALTARACRRGLLSRVRWRQRARSGGFFRWERLSGIRAVQGSFSRRT